MKINEIIQAIHNGEADGHFEQIIDAIRVRKNSQSKMLALTLQIGSHVRIKSIRPRWLEGQTGVICGLPSNGNSKRFDVKLDKEPNIVNKFGMKENQTQRGIPSACLDIIE